MDSTQQIGFQITLRHFLNASIGMGSDPAVERDVELQHSVVRWTMARFADKPEQQASAAIVSYGKADGVTGTLLRQPRTSRCVSQIAALAKIVLGGFGAFVSRRGTVSLPTATQRQARRMQPAGIIELVSRHKKWAGHEIFSLERGNCIREETGERVANAVRRVGVSRFGSEGQRGLARFERTEVQ